MEPVRSKGKMKRLLIVLMMILLIGTCILAMKQPIKKDLSINSNSELLRSMSYEQFVDGDENVEGTDNVKFSAFFLRDIDGDGYAEKLKGTCKEIGKEDTLYMEINVLTEGLLKDAKIQIDGQNFFLRTTLPKDNEIKSNYIGNNINNIEFENINNGTQKMLTGTVRSGDYTSSSKRTLAIGNNNINNYSRNDNKIIFSGTYEVATEDGIREIQIRKEISLTVDWYGKTSTTISNTNLNYKNLDNCIDRENGRLNLSFTVNTNETARELMISKNQLEVTIPYLNGYAPIEVSANNQNYTYNEATNTIIISKNTIYNENGIITTGISSQNNFTINIVYPIEAYDSNEKEYVKLEIPVQEYYEGFNNPNIEFNNPYKSNMAMATLNVMWEKYIPHVYYANPSIDIKVGRYVHNPYGEYIVSKQKPLRIYNEVSSEEKDDTYQVYWNVATGTNPSGDKIVLRETDVLPTITEVDNENQQVDRFIKTDSSLDSMENIVINKSISFSGLSSILNEDGWIRVYDDTTGILLLEINKNNISNYSNGQKFNFETPIKHFRIEIDNYKASTSLSVYSTKELDDSEITDNERGYLREEFDNLNYIRSYLVGYMGENKIGSTSHTALYVAPYSLALIEISKPIISTQITEKNEIITIDAQYNPSKNQVGWTNGDFLIKLPDEIIDIELNEVTVDNVNVTITNREVIENESGKFIKINTINENPLSYHITIDADITPDPRVNTTTKPITLNASNGEGTYYYYQGIDVYDVNNNASVEDHINETSTNIQLVSPNSLLTNSTVSEFDDKGTVVVSPQIADIRPAYVNVDNEELTAKIGVQIKNNYSNTISDLTLIGKIPFEGNKYAVTGKDLGSTYTTTMKDSGLDLPDSLEGIVDVYYSTNENPSKDLIDGVGNPNTDWLKAEDVGYWDEIKTYLIDFKDLEMAPGVEYIFYYEVEIPNGLDFNEVSYSHHGVYFSLNTEEGKYKTKTEPNKVGLRIAEKYNLELVKFQTGKDNKIPGATYVVTEIFNVDDEEKEGKSKSAITNENGIIRIDDLYTETIYEIKEIKSPEDYELNNNRIRLIGHANKQTGELTIENISGEVKGEISIVKNEDNKYITEISVEDEAKVRLKIVKVDDETNEPIKGVKFKITGSGLPEKGKNVTTNASGEINIKGLKVGEEYTLEETKIVDYYLLEGPIKFTINNNGGEYEVEIIEDGTINNTTSKIKEKTVQLEDNLPIANLKIGNEKIPTFNLELTKIKHSTRTTLSTSESNITNNDDEIVYLSGAKFKLYKDNKEIGIFVSDENGHLQINNLYQYVDGKDYDATYVLKEIMTPEGYSKVKDITFKVQNIDGQLKFIEELQEGQSAKEFRSEGNNVNIIVEDNPSFKLIKKDGETGEFLPNTKFAIYNVDDGCDPARNSKGEILGTREIIDEEEYYILATDINGEISADLPEGLYKAVEIQANDIKYDLTDNEWYFGIGASRESEEFYGFNKATSFKNITINCIANTQDGGKVLGGYFSGTILINENEYTATRSWDGILIKVDNNYDIEWIKTYNQINEVQVTEVLQTTEGDIFVCIEYYGSSLEIENMISRSINYYNQGVVAKYNEAGELIWIHDNLADYGGRIKIEGIQEKEDGSIIIYGAKGIKGFYRNINQQGEIIEQKTIGDSADDEISKVIYTTDGGLLIAGEFYDTNLTIGNQTFINQGTTTDCFVVKYSPEGNVEWCMSYGGASGDTVVDAIITTEGDYIIIGNSSSPLFCVDGNEIENAGSSDGYLLILDKNGEFKQLRQIAGNKRDYLSSIVATEDGGCLIGGYLESTSIIIDGFKLRGCINNNSYNYMIIKFKNDGVAEWVKGREYGADTRINKIIKNDDNNYSLVGGTSVSISLGNKTVENGCFVVDLEKIEMPKLSYSWGKNLKNVDPDITKSIKETKDGGLLVSVGFRQQSIQIEDQIIYNKNTSSNGFMGLLIKYNSVGKLEWIREFDERVGKVLETKDGGIIVIVNGDITKQVIKYDSKWNELWRKGFAHGSCSFNGVVETAQNEYIVVGTLRNSYGIDVEKERITVSSLPGTFMIKYAGNGEKLWAKAVDYGEKTAVSTIFRNTKTDELIIGGNINDNGFIESIDEDGNGIWRKQFEGSLKLIQEDHKGNYLACLAGKKIIRFTRDSITIVKELNIGISSLAETKNREIIVGGAISTDYGRGVMTFDNFFLGNDDSWKNGYLLKIKEDGTIDWAENIDVYRIDNVLVTKKNGIMFTALYYGNSVLGKFSFNSSNSYSSIVGRLNIINGANDAEIVEINNQRKQYHITTDVKEIDNVKGGTISGEDKKPYEIVKYGDNSQSEIKMIPDENHEIISINVNGKEWSFEKNIDGSYDMPQFTNMTEDKHVIVTYALKDNKIIINKRDSVSGENLTGAEFDLDQIEERNEPVANEIFGNLVDNGMEYVEIDWDNEITGRIGNMTTNGDYYFVQNESGSYIPINSKTWQEANIEGATTGVQSSTAHSYMEINLLGLEGKYKILVNAHAYSQSGDYGFARITSDTEPLAYSNTTGRFICISGTSTSTRTDKDYESTLVLEGGNTYYLHFGYYKNGNTDTGDDNIVINSVKLFKSKDTQYNFEKVQIEENEELHTIYQSTNQGKDGKVSNSYIPIDLSEYSGKYNITVNAEISTYSGDYGYVTINKTASPAPAYSINNIENIRFVYMTGEQPANDYTVEVDGGYEYYLHLGYYKDSSTNKSGDDKFKVNSIDISLSDSELYHTTVEVNSMGQVITQIPFGKYQVTEINTPNDYVSSDLLSVYDKEDNLINNEGIIEFRSIDGSNHEFIIKNEKYAHVKVHHYIKGTTTKVAEDEELIGKQGDKYSTNAIVDLEKYELETNSDSGELVLPDNKSGTYTYDDIEVIYYYVPRKINLIVHHYVVDSAMPVPLLNGELAEDIISSGNENEEYATSAISNSELSDEYELAEIPENATGTYQYPDVEVTYYYKKVERSVIINKYGDDGVEPLQDVLFNINTTGNNNKLVSVGEMTPNGTYYFEKYNGKYVSNNKGKSYTAISYVVIDTTLAKEDIEVTVNAQISSKSIDYGYATISESATAPSYSTNNSANRRFMYISGVKGATDYSTTLTKGKVYYLHLGYRKSSTSNGGTDDVLTINSITVEGSDETNLMRTDNKGRIEYKLGTGSYVLTEIQALEGYKLLDETYNISINRDSENQVLNIRNEKVKGNVIVHHYLVDDDGNPTTNKAPLKTGGVAEDEEKTGIVGDSYATKPCNVVGRYGLVEEPDNGSGEYIDGDIEVIYYYRLRPTSVLVHHYIEGTTTNVPNNTGGIVEDVVIDGIVDDVYSTSAATNIPEYYELVSEPINMNGSMTAEQIVVTYYYKLKKYPYVVNYLLKDNDDDDSNNTVLHPQKSAEADFNTTIYSNDEKVSIEGYKVDQSTAESIRIVEGENVLNIYYEVDSDQTKTINYTVEYYKDGELQVNDTDEVELTLQVLEDDILDVDKDAINMVDKYPGYTFKEVIPDPIPDTIEDGGVIKVYYIKTKYPYRIEYYYDEVIDGNATVTGKAYKNDEINQYEPKLKDGYAFDRVEEFPLTISDVGENVIKVHYYTIRTIKVNHIDRNTNEILDTEEYQGKSGNTITTSEEDIPEYICVEKPDVEEYTYSENEQIVNYYYAKVSSGVLEKHIDEQTNSVLSEEHHPGEVGKHYEIDSKEISQYILNTDRLPDNAEGEMTAELIEVRYYYNKETKVIVHYIYKEGDNETEIEQLEIPGYVSKEYETQKKDYDEYVYDSSSTNTEGVMTEEVINVFYYYKKEAKVVVHYICKEGDNETAIEKVEIPGFVGETYDTVKKDYNGYIYDSSTTNTTGTMTEDTINVYYYYKKEAKVVVHYIYKEGDKETEIDQLEIPGYVSKEYETHKKNYAEYVYDSSSTNTEGTMTEDAINVYYYYKKEAKVVAHYICKEGDKETEIEQQEIPGFVGDTYESTKKDYAEYVYDTSSTNTEGTMTEDTINVYYYYKKEAKVVAHYIYKEGDKETEIEQLEIPGFVGDTYESTQKKYNEYVYDSSSTNTEGTMTEDAINVYYYYKKEAKVVAHYIYKEGDKETEIEQLEIPGFVGETYDINKKEYDEYVYDSSSTNTTGTMTADIINVYYYYTKPAQVVVKTIDMVTGDEIEIPQDILGNVGDNYSTTGKEIEDYVLVKDTQNTTGTMEEEVTEVIYYYSPKATVNVKYVDKETGEELVSSETINGYIGKDYTTDEKEFLDYYYVSSTDNTTGKMTEKITEVIYYYNKSGQISYSTYTINYLDSETGKPINIPKTVNNQEIGTTIYAKALIIDIDGYTFDEADKDSIIIKDGENVINLYYIKDTEEPNVEPKEEPKEEPKTEPKVDPDDEIKTEPKSEPKNETTPKKQETTKVVPQTNTAEKVAVRNTHKSNLVTTILGASFIFVGCAIIVVSKFKHKEE